MPGWGLSAAGSKDGEKGSKRKTALAEVAKELRGKKVSMEEVMSVLLKLSLMNSEAIRDITGAIFLTFQIPNTGKLCSNLAESGQSYHDATVGKKPEDHKMGPPYLHSWVTLVKTCYEEAKEGKEKDKTSHQGTSSIENSQERSRTMGVARPISPRALEPLWR